MLSIKTFGRVGKLSKNQRIRMALDELGPTIKMGQVHKAFSYIPPSIAPSHKDTSLTPSAFPPSGLKFHRSWY